MYLFAPQFCSEDKIYIKICVFVYLFHTWFRPKYSIFHSSSQVSSSPSSSHNKYDNPADNILLDSDNDRDANKNKIFGLISLTTKSKKRNQNPNNEIDKAAKKAAKEEKHRNKQKDASRKEKKATQTLAIVLGMIFSNFWDWCEKKQSCHATANQKI